MQYYVYLLDFAYFYYNLLAIVMIVFTGVYVFNWIMTYIFLLALVY